MADHAAKPLDGTAALVTGASAGIGRACARSLAAKGADIGLAARRESALADLADELKADYGVRTFVQPTDVRDREAVVAAVEGVVDAAGRLDVLVNNAGVTGDGFETRLEEMSPENFERVLRTNVAGTFYATRTALPHLRETKGNLIFVGSSAGKLPRPGAPVYAASKWWTRGFALSIEAHAGQDGVGVTLVNPTAVRTEMWPDLDPGEAAEPEEVAAVVSLAARQEAHTTLSEVDLFRRDLLGKLVPNEIDLDLAFDLDRPRDGTGIDTPD
jgi:NADP-dependent 3-hydroxy acid dehydrogenase YdfG